MNREMWHQPDPMLPKSRHQSMKALLLKSERPPAPPSWWMRFLLRLDRVLWP